MPNIRRVAVALFTLVASLSLSMQATPAAADTGWDEVAMAGAVNQIRATVGLPALAIKGELFDVARAWSRSQAATGDVRHNPSLGRQAPSTWLRLAENVAAGPDVWAMFNGLVASPSHLLNMVDGRFDSIGVGIVQSGATYYATMVFMTTGASPPPCQRWRRGRCIRR